MRSNIVSVTNSFKSMTKARVAGETWQTRQSYTKAIETDNHTRGDIVRSPAGVAFRPPLAYSAYGRTATFPMINFIGTYTSGGTVPTVWDVVIHGATTWFSLNSPAPETLLPSSDISRAIIEMLKQVGDEKFSVGQMVVEMQSSIDLIGDSARVLSRAMMFASRKSWKNVAKSLNVEPKALKKGTSASDGWLQYQFGWAPVVDDIVNSCALLGGVFDGQDPPVIMARTKRATSVVNRSTGVISTSFGLGNLDIPYKREDIKSHEYKASVYYELDVAYLREFAQFGLAGLSTPWAVLPMSFLADWVIPIGDYLAAWDATIGLKYKGGSYTNFLRTTSALSFDEHRTSTGTKLSGDCFSLPVNRYQMDRVVWPSSPLPFPAYIKNPFSVFKTVTSVALLKQFSSGK